MYISREYFDEWMKRIMERLEAIDGRLITAIRADQRIGGDVILDNQDLLNILKISVRTLQRIRNSGKLPFYTMNKKNYYLKSDVEKYIKEYFGKGLSLDADNETVE